LVVLLKSEKDRDIDGNGMEHWRDSLLFSVWNHTRYYTTLTVGVASQTTTRKGLMRASLMRAEETTRSWDGWRSMVHSETCSGKLNQPDPVVS
jgi:hypothetical protein